MEIKELNLVAFGPFTDRTLVFDREPGRIQIVYGPNEAGKSSALRGLKSLLYGFAERTSDNFIHSNEKLRVGGCLRTADGQELAFLRRKGRKNTLFSPTDEALDDLALIPLLKGVTPEVFETLFGIDHGALVQGGEEILQQKGEVGQALFSAALGSHVLHGVLEQLDNEASAIFLPRGSTQEISKALTTYHDLRKQIREHSLSSRKWDEHRRALSRTTKELEQLQGALSQARFELNRLQRIHRVLPKLARRRDLQKTLDAMGEVVVLSEDFGQRRYEARGELETAQALQRDAESRFTALKTQLDGLEVRSGVVAHGDAIEALHARLGTQRKSVQEQPQLEAECKQLRAGALALLQEVRPGLALQDIGVLQQVFARRKRITELANQHRELVLREEQAAATRRDIQNRLADIQETRLQQTAPDSPDALKRAVVAARTTGDLDALVQNAREEFEARQAQCAIGLAQLGLWSGDYEALERLAVPMRESVQRFEEEYDGFEQRIQRLKEKEREWQEALRDTGRQLDEIQRAGAVPTEKDMLDARGERDQAWQLLRQRWLAGEGDAPDEDDSLAAHFEGQMSHADELADRLRREADRVHKQANLLAGQEDAKGRIAEIQVQLVSCRAEKTRLDEQWKGLWSSCNIQPHSPREMRAWLDRFDKLREQVEHLNLQGQRVGELEHRRHLHIRQLNEPLLALGRATTDEVTLHDILIHSENVIEAIEESRRRKEALEKERKTWDSQLRFAASEEDVARQALETWATQWRGLIEDLGLASDTQPSEVAEVVEKVGDMFAKLKEADKLQIRLEAIDREKHEFCEQVSAMVAEISPEFGALAADQAVMRLNVLLSESRSRQSRREQLDEQMQQLQQQIHECAATIARMHERLAALCREARCESQAELEAAERRSGEYSQLKRQIREIEQEILEAGDGASLATLEQEAGKEEADALPGRIDALSREIDEVLEPKRTTLAENKGRQEKELEIMDGGDRAARLSEQSQEVLAAIRAHAERYVRVKLAARILRDQIERYRQENQGPLLQRASEHFAQLTRLSFEGLRADFNERDEPVLVGLRPDGQRVYVEGMSAGTRDQLYLALRLASLEKYMENSEPMPFIVDDILVDFDDERSNAALGALSALAQKTQVILFTHHSRIVEMGRDHGASIHNLYLSP